MGNRKTPGRYGYVPNLSIAIPYANYAAGRSRAAIVRAGWASRGRGVAPWHWPTRSKPGS